jgi:hypothetical protein
MFRGSAWALHEGKAKKSGVGFREMALVVDVLIIIIIIAWRGFWAGGASEKGQSAKSKIRPAYVKEA